MHSTESTRGVRRAVALPTPARRGRFEQENLNPKKQVKPVGDMGSNRWGTWAGLQIREQTAIKGDELRGLLVRAHLGSRQLPARQWSVSVERFQETQS